MSLKKNASLYLRKEPSIKYVRLNKPNILPPPPFVSILTKE